MKLFLTGQPKTLSTANLVLLIILFAFLIVSILLFAYKKRQKKQVIAETAQLIHALPDYELLEISKYHLQVMEEKVDNPDTTKQELQMLYEYMKMIEHEMKNRGMYKK